MQIELKQFKTISNEFNKVKKFLADGSYVYLKYSYEKGALCYELSFHALKFKNIANFYQFNKHITTTVTPIIDSNNQAFLDKMKLAMNDIRHGTVVQLSKEVLKDFKTAKFIPQDTLPEHLPLIIFNDPLEITEGNSTYRVLIDSFGRNFFLVAKSEDKIYDYLDKGFYIQKYFDAKKKSYTFVVANELDINVAHIFLMCKLQPKLAESLQNGCFINVHDAELTRLRLEKRLSVQSKAEYEKVRATLENDYYRNTTLLVVNKLKGGQLEKTSLNDISLTASAATYENISINCENLLDVLYNELNFSGEFDIYSMIETYGKAIEKRLAGVQDKDYPKNDADVPQDYILPALTINGIPIEVSMTPNGVRRINGVRINKDEIAKALHRASCYTNADEYRLFLKTISKMSIRWHDVVANGLPIKMHTTITNDEYQDPVPSLLAPAIKFFIDVNDKCIKLQVDKDTAVKVSLAKLIKRADTTNRLCNGGYTYRGARYRNFEWAQTEMASALVEAATFTKKVKNDAGVLEEKTEVLITKEQIRKVLAIVADAKKKAIERSREFLDVAIKMTGAKDIQFNGKPAYWVKGKLREYAIVVDNAKVYDFKTKKYRCIVNSHHYKGAGFDDIASRLLALANDSMMQKEIGTLQGEHAQPGAENAHNDYRPERDVIEDALAHLEL